MTNSTDPWVRYLVGKWKRENPPKEEKSRLALVAEGGIVGAALGLVPGSFFIFALVMTQSVETWAGFVAAGSMGAMVGMILSPMMYRSGYDSGKNDEAIVFMREFREWESKNIDNVRRLSDALVEARTELKALKKT